MFWILMIMAILTGTLLQIQVPGVVFLGGARWPVLCSVVLYYALNHRGVAGVVSGFTAGLLIDTLSMTPLGFSVLLFCIIAWLAGRCRKLVLPEATVTAAFFGGLAGLVYASLLYLLLLRGGLQACSPFIVAARIAGGGVLGALTAPVTFLVLSYLHKALNLDEQEDNGRVNQ